MTRALLLSSLVVVFVPLPARAEPLGEDAYVERALAADPRIRIAEAEVEVVAADEVGAALRANPSIGVDREQVFGDGGDTEHVLALDLPLDLSGRRRERIAAAEARTAAARAMTGASQADVTLDARTAYREAAFLRARAALLVEGRVDLVRALEIVRARLEAGDIAAVEVERVELELVEYDDEIAEAELERDAAERALGARLGLDAVETTGAVVLPEAPAELEALRGSAARRAERVALDHLDEAADAEAAAASRAWFPDLVLRGGTKSLSVDDGTHWGYVIGVAVELPLFDRGKAEKARARAAKRRVAAAREGLDERTATRIEAARDHLEKRRALAENSTAERAGRIESLIKAAEAAYRGGGPLADLLDVYRLQRRARLRALDLRHDAALAEIDLWRAVGRLP